MAVWRAVTCVIHVARESRTSRQRSIGGEEHGLRRDASKESNAGRCWAWCSLCHSDSMENGVVVSQTTLRAGVLDPEMNPSASKMGVFVCTCERNVLSNAAWLKHEERGVGKVKMLEATTEMI